MDELQNTLDIIYDDLKNININSVDSNNINNINDLYNQIKMYENKINNIVKTVEIVTSLKDNLKKIFNCSILQIKKNINSNNQMISDSISTNKNIKNAHLSIEYKNITNNNKFKNENYVKCPIIKISNDNIDNIINTPIYYLNDTKEYCIKINNKLIKGNIGNIFSDEAYNKKESTKIYNCNKINCNNTHYNKKECKYYHQGDVRNFTNYSWKYISKNKLGKVYKKNNKQTNYNYDNENTRHVGSLDSLHEDLLLTNNGEKDLRNKQLMHDILIYQVLSQYLEL